MAEGKGWLTEQSNGIEDIYLEQWSSFGAPVPKRVPVGLVLKMKQTPEGAWAEFSATCPGRVTQALNLKEPFQLLLSFYSLRREIDGIVVLYIILSISTAVWRVSIGFNGFMKLLLCCSCLRAQLTSQVERSASTSKLCLGVCHEKLFHRRCILPRRAV